MKHLTIVEQKLVDFNGAEIMAVKASNGKVYAGVRWICRGIGLNEDQATRQTKKINEDAVLSKGSSKMTIPTAGGNQEVVVIEIEYLPLWLAKINANIIEDSEVQDRLIDYQLRAKDVLASAFVNPVGLEDLIILQAQSVKELKAKVTLIEEKTIAAHHRIDSLDTTNIEGTLRQHLEKMVKRYAWANGLTYSAGWRSFDQFYNTAFHTNLTALRQNHCKRNGLKDITRPEYLEAAGRLEDAIRVADKMLNDHAAALA